MAGTHITSQQAINTFDTSIKNIGEARNKAVEGKTHWSLFGLHIPKGPLAMFSQGDISRINERYDRAEQLSGQICSQITQALAQMCNVKDSSQGDT